MKTILVFAVGIIVLLIVVVVHLLYKNHLLYKKMKYVDEANMWHQLAITDDLTGIYNRTAYNQYITELEETASGRPWGIILFDVDEFKAINDTKGHLEGDKILQKVAKTLTEVFFAADYRVFRIGGDEFAVIAENIDEPEMIRLLLVLRERFEADGEIRVSKGYAIVKNNVNKAFKEADEMLYADKASER